MDGCGKDARPAEPRPEPGDHTPLGDAGTSGRGVPGATTAPVRGTMQRSMIDDDPPPPAPPQTLARALADYRCRWPGEGGVADAFQALARQASEGADPYTRARLAGHFTGSAWVVDASGMRTLLTHHRKLDRWLQPGGHADGERDLRAVALKEAEEETGLRGLVVEGDLFDLDRHWIPARRDVPGHWHFDARYVVRATAGEDFVVGDESHALAWRGIAAIAADDAMDPSLRRMARKWLALTSASL